MIKDDCIVKTSFAPLYSKPTFKSELISQALIWEYLFILDKKDNWYKIKQPDDYISWIHKSYIVNNKIYIKNNLNSLDKWHYLTKTFSDKNIDGPNYLSFASVLPVIKKIDNSYYGILLPNEKVININKNYLIQYNSPISIKKINKYFNELIGIPYLWGGKSSFGYDCSGLVQTILTILGIKFPRDTLDQIKSDKLYKIENNPELGDLIFFKKDSKVCHVGFYINNNEFIHSSGYVKYASIIKNNKYFDIKLFKMEYEIYRFKQK